MKVLELLGEKVSVDTDKLSRGLCELHNEDEDKKAVLAFGMLDFELCEMMDKGIKERVIKEFDSITNELFKGRIDDFIKDCQNEVGKGVYKYAKMIV